MTKTTRKRPSYKRELLERAKGTEEPVTEVDWNDSGRAVRVHAIQEYDGTAYRAQITDYVKFESSPSVKFAKSYWNADVGTLQDWTPLATGSLSGPQDLSSWESLFTVFNSALGVYNREVRMDD